MTGVLLMNPNSSARTTEAMCAIAARDLPAAPAGWTAPNGPELISTPEALRMAAEVVAAIDPEVWPAVIIVSGFGDPGAESLARRAPCPVIGIGAAAARAASGGGATFAVATMTPALAPLIDALMRRHGGDGYLGCFCSGAEPTALMSDREALDTDLLGEIEKASEAGAARVIIGGGPLGESAERLRGKSPVRLINPITCAAREAAAFLESSHD